MNGLFLRHNQIAERVEPACKFTVGDLGAVYLKGRHLDCRRSVPVSYAVRGQSFPASRWHQTNAD